MNRVYRIKSILIFWFLSGMALAPMTQAATIVVNGFDSTVADNDGRCTLVEAIIAANSDSTVGTVPGECVSGNGADTIELMGDVTLTRAFVLGTPGDDNGLPSITSEITIDGNNATIRRDPALFSNPQDPCSLITGGEFEFRRPFRIFFVFRGGNLTLNEVTVANGCATSSDSDDIGSGDIGGGILNQGTLTLRNSTLANNAALLGGGVSNSGSLTLNNSTVSHNAAGIGAGGIDNSGTLLLFNSVIVDNAADIRGGGILNQFEAGLDVINSTISGNTSDGGGGVDNFGRLTLINSTVSGNEATEQGGGISTSFGTLNLINSAIVDNAGPTGAGIDNVIVTFINGGAGEALLKNTIIANNISGPNCSGPMTSLGNNLDSDGSCGLDPALSDLPSTEPQLGPLQDNGGPTFTHALMPGSPAVDAGDDADCPGTDQRGFRRPVDGNGDGDLRCDIGAYELLTATMSRVNNSDDAVDLIPGDGVCNTGRSTLPECTLRAAIQEANALGGVQMIDLPPGIYVLGLAGAGENAALTGDLDITDDVNILGHGAGNTIIDGGGTDRVFHILGSVTVGVGSVTIQNGNADAESGGGIANGSGGTLILTNSVVRANAAVGNGGGIVNFGSLDITGSSLNENVSGGRGGAIGNAGALDVVNSTISGNSAVAGGGIDNATSTAIAELTNATVSENIGSGLDNASGGIIDLKNTIVANNGPGPDCSGPIVSNGNNLASDNTCGLTAAGDLPETDPRLGPLQRNGSDTLTHALLQTTPASPAIDSADDSACPATDQRGVTRPLDGDGDDTRSCDMGAFEAPELPFQANLASRVLPAAAAFSDNPQLAYVMIGSPLDPENPDPLTLLNGLGLLNPFSARLFREDVEAEGRVEFFEPGDPEFSFERGRGFWLISRSGGSVVIAGTPGNAAEPFEINLEEGWNQIATPFNFAIRWTECVVSALPDAVSPALIGFEQDVGGFVDVDVMQPMFGFLVFASAAATLSISPECVLPDSDPAAPGGALLAASTAWAGRSSASEGWRVKLSVAVGAATDAYNYLGVDVASQDGLDASDYPEPPPIHGLSLRFPHPEWNASSLHYMSDIRGVPSDAPRVWDFEVRTDFADAGVELSWEIDGTDTPTLTLWDMEGNRIADMGRDSRYVYNSGAGGIRRFRITAE